MRGGGHDHAALPRHQTVGEQQLVGEDGTVFIEAVAVAVLQDADAALRRLARRRAVGVVAHLDDPEPAVLVERHRHGTLEVGLGGDEFHAQPRGDAEGPQGLLRGERAVDPGPLLLGGPRGPARHPEHAEAKDGSKDRERS